MILKLNKYITSLFCALFFCMLIVADINAQESERILNFHSDIKVEQSGRVLVTELIMINVTGESISRGIVRTIPIYRTDIYGRKQRMDITVLSIKRDDQQEDYSTKIEGNDFAVYIGNENHYLIPNIYIYTIQYESYGHVGFFDNYDEIYWNVTGNDWAFPIDSASATVHVPQGSKVISNSCYTGRKGSKSSICNYTVEGDSIVNFSSAQHLLIGDGFTVATSFTPNIIERPTPPSQFSVFFNTYYFFIMLVGGVVSFICYLVFILKKYGTINKRSVVVPTFYPPDGKSAAQLRYLDKKEIDSKAMAASIVSMAVKNAISIENREWNYIISKKAPTNDLSDEERNIYNALFKDERSDQVLLSKKYNYIWGVAYARFKSIVEKKDQLRDYFIDKSIYFEKILKTSIYFMIVWLAISFFIQRIDLIGIFAVTITTAFVISTIMWYYYHKTSCLFYFYILFFTIPALVIQYGFIISSEVFYKYTFGFIYGLLFLNFIFMKLFSSETNKGLKFMTELKGFEMYLKTAEEKRFDILTPPDKTPQQFEKLLPYAIALDLEIAWAKKFATTLKQYNYQPTWYEGKPITSYTEFSNSISIYLTSTMKDNTRYSSSSGNDSDSSWRGSSSSSSGSSSWSSGSSGSGSSGGGGGGGGGRGW